MLTSTDIKQNIQELHYRILSSDKPDLYLFSKLLKLSSYVVNGDIYIKDVILYFLSINYHQILYHPNIKSSLLKEGHLFWFHNKGEKTTKIESAVYLLENFQCYENREIKIFITRNKDDPVIGYKCKELIKRFNINTIEREDDFKHEQIEITKKNLVEDKINTRLKNSGDEKRKIYLNRRVMYDNTQNVHITEINESMKTIVERLHTEYKNILLKEKTRVLNEVSTFIYSIKEDIVTTTKIKGSFDRILSDPSHFTSLNLTMMDICLLVWIKLNTSKNNDELKKRFREELVEMNGMCATGHVTRLINVLSGFFDDCSIKTHYKDQIKIYVNNHYNKMLSIHPQMDILIEEITETDMEKKKNIIKFIHDNGIRNKLFSEYRKHPDVTLEKFNKWYDEAKNAYMGVV